MEKSLIFGGFGGQGVQTMGKLLAYGANDAGYYVTFSPSYGGAMRGGTSDCIVMISDEEIASPTKQMVDCVVAMSNEALSLLVKRVAPGGTLVVNTSIIKELPEQEEITVVGIPANRIAEECGSIKALNVVIMGFLAEMLGVVPKDIMQKTLTAKLGKKEEFAAMNNAAFKAGVEFAANVKKRGTSK